MTMRFTVCGITQFVLASILIGCGLFGGACAGELRAPDKEKPAVTPRAVGPVSATLSGQAGTDSNANGKVDPGDSIKYSATVKNPGDTDAQAVKVTIPLDKNLALVPGSVKTTPVAANDNLTAFKDTPLNVAAPGVLANDFGIPAPVVTPVAGGPTTLGGTVTLNADGSFTYTPPVGVVSPPNDTFTYSVTNPNGTDSATVTVTIASNPPVLAAIEAGALAYTENDAAVAITGAITVTDSDSTTLANGTVAISANFQLSADVLGFTNVPATMGNIAGSYSSGTGVLTLTSAGATATLGEWQAALRAVTYSNSSKNPSTLARTVTFTVNDGATASNTQTRNIGVTGVNDAPVAVAGGPYTATTNIQISVPAANGLLVNSTDVDSSAGTLTMDTTAINVTAGASVTLNADGSFVFNPAPGMTGAQTFQYRVQDSGPPAPGKFSAYTTVTVTVSGAVIWFTDSAAAAGGNGTLAKPFNTLAAANTAANNAAHKIFVASGNYTGGITLASGVGLVGQGASGSFDTVLGITPPAGSLARPPLGGAKPNITGGAITLGSNNVVNGLKLSPSSGNGLTLSANIGTAGSVTNVDIDASGTATAVTSSSGFAGTLNYTTGTITNTGSGTSIAINGGNSSTGSMNFNNVSVGQSGTGRLLSGAFQAGGTISFTGTSVLNCTATIAQAIQIQSCPGTTFNLGALNLQPAGAGNTGIQLANGAGTVNSASGTISCAGLAVDIGGGATTLGLVLTSVSSTNAGGSGIFVSGASGTANFGTTTVSGSATSSIDLQGNSAALTFGATTITKTSGAGSAVRLGGITANSGKITFGSLSINSTGSPGLTATDNTGAIEVTNNTGVISSPGFTPITITGASAASRTPLNINLGTVSTTSSNQQGIRLANVSGTFTCAGGSLTNSSSGGIVITGSTANVTYGGTISQASGSNAVNIANQSSGTVTLSGAIDVNTAGLGLLLATNTGGTINFSGKLTLSTGSGTAINASGGGIINTSDATSTIATTSGQCLNIQNTSLACNFASVTSSGGRIANITSSPGTKTLGKVTMSAPNGTGIPLDLISAGTVNIGDAAALCTVSTSSMIDVVTLDGTSLGISGLGLSVTATGSGRGIVAGNTAPITCSGAAAGVFISAASGTGYSATSGGTVSLSGGSNLSTITTTTGTALNVANTTIGASGLTFASVSTNGAANGIVLDTVGAGAATINGGSIVNATARGVDINGGSGNFTYSGTITTSGAAARSVEITNHTGGTIALSGAVTDTSLGISLMNNTGATINFTGNIQASTGANTAFDATGGGTISATNTNSTITTTAGTALNVTNTTIGAAGLTFKSISAGTAAGSAGNGITLDTTGATGFFTITGTGTAGSGGTIQHKTGADGSTTSGIGIYLNSTSNVQLNRMQINDCANFAIRGSSVTGFTFDDSAISGINGSAVGAFDEAAISFTNLLGTASISRSNIGHGFEFIVTIINNSGTLNRLTIDNTTFGTNNDAASGNGGDAFQFVTNNSATANVTVTNSTFTSAGANLFNAVVHNASNMDVVFRSNNVSNNHANQAGAASNVLVASSSTGNVTYDISHNTVVADTVSAIKNTSNGIAVAKGVPDSGAGGSMIGTVNANTIGQNGVVNSGSAFTGIAVTSLGTGTHTTAITNNTIYHFNEEGIFLKANDPLGGGTSILNATVTGNQTLQPDSLAFAGIWILAGSGSGSENQVINVVLGNNSTTGLKNDFSNGDPANATDVEIQELGSNCTINLTKAGSAAGTAAQVVKDCNLNPATTTVDAFGNIVLVTTFPTTPPTVPPLMLADGGVDVANRVTINKVALTQAQLDGLVSAARAQWEATGLIGAQRASLQEVRFEVANLGRWRLGEAGKGMIRVDAMAGGAGWYVGEDSNNVQFMQRKSATRGYTTPEKDAAGRIDLLTTIMHEMGHALGLPDRYEAEARDSIMYGYLTKGERRVPAVGEATRSWEGKGGMGGRENGGLGTPGGSGYDVQLLQREFPIGSAALWVTLAAIGSGFWMRRRSVALIGLVLLQGAVLQGSVRAEDTVTLDIPVLPAGKQIVILFEATVAKPVSAGTSSVSVQATLTGANFAAALSDDPATAAANDATVIALENSPPALPSAITATPNPALPGQSVQFNAAATDADLDTLTFAWDFKDGSSSPLQVPAHVYTTPGTYAVSLTLNDGRGGVTTGTVSVVVQSAPGDLDGDKFSDEIENALGSSPLSDVSRPFDLPSPAATGAFVIPTLKIALDFAKPNKDSIALTGMLPVGASTPAKQILIVDVGGVVRKFDVDAKGRAKAGNDKLSVSVSKGSVATKANKKNFNLKLSKGLFATALADEQLTASSASGPRTVNVTVIYANTVFTAAVPQTYKVRKTTGKTAMPK